MPSTSVTFPQMGLPYAVQAIPPWQVQSATSSVLNTPVFTCFSSPVYANTYGCISTPVLSSTFCTPIPYQMSHNDVPSTLHLDKKALQAGSIPRGLSCNINMRPVTECTSPQEGHICALKTSRKQSTNQPKSALVRTVPGCVEMMESAEEVNL